MFKYYLCVLLLLVPAKINTSALQKIRFRALPPVLTKTIKNRSGFIFPITGRMSSKFGRRNKGFHTGIDISNVRGTPIKAAKSGRVTYAGYCGGYGKLVVIQHEKYVSKYAHCSKLLVRRNMLVKQGEIIALVGSTGHSTGNHLHFEIMLGKSYINPLSLL